MDGSRVQDRRLLGDVELQEVVPPVEGGGVERVDVSAVGEGEPFASCPGEVLGQIGTVTAGLLVRPLAGHEHRHVDLVDEGDRRQRVGDGGYVVIVGADLGQQVRRLAVEDLIGPAGLVPLLDPLVGPALPAVG